MKVKELKARLAKFNDVQEVVIAGDTIYEDGFIPIKNVSNITVSPTPHSERRSSWMGEYTKDENAFIVACLLEI